ncbi:MAG: asparaginase domain-containing protein [Candidatus Diapherotrites archaeon]|nr:asparaginase domain-containing protein [Candidatus Diapherotrites archaeon]
MAIKIFVTGGTFDKDYDEITQTLMFKKTNLQDMLKISRVTQEISIETIMLIDSLEMTDDGRKKILQKCLECKDDKIVITHGTDTSSVTAEFLQGKIKNKTIVITGGMRPYLFGNSDALFNLGGAIAFAQSLPYGIYITMNGKLFKAGKVKKNKTTGYFEEI